MRRGRWWWTAASLALVLSGPGARAFGQSEPAGSASLMARSPLSGEFEPVTLIHTDVDIDVRGLVAATTVVQRYQNRSDQPLEAVYVFPLPHDAAVYDMEVRIGDRLIKSVVQEREEARKTYAAARAEGRRAALVEQERPNIFTSSVANIMPGDRVDVRIRFVEPLAFDGGILRLVFPMVVGPRYVPGSGVPDAPRVTPPIRHPDSRPGHDITVKARLDLGVPLTSITSPSHPIRVAGEATGVPVVTLENGPTLPNKDFVLEIHGVGLTAPQTSLFLSPDPDGDESSFMMVAHPPSIQRQSERLPLELIFLVDVSGSMAGTSMDQARRALASGLDRLRSTDRFNLVVYSSGFRSFREESLPAQGSDLQAGRRFVAGLDADGGTELQPALEHVLAMPPREGFLRYVVLMTDGCLGNEDEVFRALQRGLGNARLFTVAIGSAPNHHLATKMAEFGRGSFTHIASVEEVAARMGELFDRIESPVLSDIELAWEGVSVQGVYPSRVPDLFRARPLVVHGRLSGRGPGRLLVRGSANGKPYAEAVTFDTRKAAFHPGITTLWARQAVEERMDAWRAADGEARQSLRGEIVDFAVRHRIVCAFTSLVAVEERVVNEDGESRRVAVPTELPEGWKLEKVVGENPVGGTADAFLELTGLWLVALGVFLLTLRRGAEGRQ